MYAKQYEITLPADYDMETIRKRVSESGHLLDDRAGLGLKAYVIHHWQLLRFVLWADSSVPDEEATERYEVLHLSAPGLGDLPEGRDW
ncbi:DUF4865 family protein [Streptomyces reniochalinae]|uniref:DUF4865 family protein n=1 Tax=Streptomyces reniochalinae TaxID=2250578 RepID=A0A367EB17_9ACTN|nr:DUF4865 family protein [Streptomyces reniochalinae]RCG15254.1 DUF4865 family protein [Streptomyces reniochalinae]